MKQSMDKYDQHVEDTLKWYRGTLEKESRWMVSDALKEVKATLKGEKVSSKMNAYKAALIVRRAYRAFYLQNAHPSTPKEATTLMLAMTAEAGGLRSLGYGTDDYHPLLEQGKMRRPPLVRFDKRHPQPEYRKSHLPDSLKNNNGK
mgnify:FL=1